MQCPGDLGPSSFTRQELTAAPYAIYATASGSANYAYGAPWSGITERPAGLDDGDDDTQYTNGSGLNLAGHEFSINPSYTQRRISSTCATGRSIREILEDGTVVCEIDDGTSYLAGSGISLAGLPSRLIRHTPSAESATYVRSAVPSMQLMKKAGVECQSDQPGRPAYNMTTLDLGYQAGWQLDNHCIDGLGLIAYRDGGLFEP